MWMKMIWTVLKHKWFILISGWRLKVPMWKLLIHDLSKFSPAEFIPYARYHYGEPDLPAYARAWKHHYAHNSHHYEYWGGKPMPEIAVREMVADWMAAGKVYNGRWPDLSNFTWFRQNEHRIRMHPSSWQWLHIILDEAAGFRW